MESADLCVAKSKLPVYFAWSYLSVYFGILVGLSVHGAREMFQTYALKMNVHKSLSPADKLAVIVAQDEKKQEQSPEDKDDIIVVLEDDTKMEENATQKKVVCQLRSFYLLVQFF